MGKTKKVIKYLRGISKVKAHKVSVEPLNASPDSEYPKKEAMNENPGNEYPKKGTLSRNYQDMEKKIVDFFQPFDQSVGDDISKGNNTINSSLNHVLNTATELVRNEKAPYVNPRWPQEHQYCIAVLWRSRVAHHCSNQILKHIGGPEGAKLPEVDIPQLLGLIGWIELFRKQTEDAFPQVVKLRNSKNTDSDKNSRRFRIFIGDETELVVDSALKFLAGINNNLWEVHQFTQGEFLLRTLDQTDAWLENIYRTPRTQNQSNDGVLTSSLCEDVFSLVDVQLWTFRKHLSNSSETLVMAACMIFSILRVKQIHCRDNLLHDLLSACTAANDFARMGNKCEEIIESLQRQCQFSNDMRDTLEESASELISLYSVDAVYAAQFVHVYVFEPIHGNISYELFGQDWEQNLRHNEIALKIVRTMKDFLVDIEKFLLGDYLVKKTVDALAIATVAFYIKCLLVKAEKLSNAKKGRFNKARRALNRMKYDIDIMRAFFEDLVPRMPSLSRVIEQNFELLVATYECMSIAVENSVKDANDFIFFIHKHLNNVELTKYFLGDLWCLVAPLRERQIMWEYVDSIKNDLTTLHPKKDESLLYDTGRHQVPGLRLDTMIASLYLESTRTTKMKSLSFENMKSSLKKSKTATSKIRGRSAKNTLLLQNTHLRSESLASHK